MSVDMEWVVAGVVVVDHDLDDTDGVIEDDCVGTDAVDGGACGVGDQGEESGVEGWNDLGDICEAVHDTWMGRGIRTCVVAGM